MEKILKITIAGLQVGAFITFDINKPFISVSLMWIAAILFFGMISEMGRREINDEH